MCRKTRAVCAVRVDAQRTSQRARGPSTVNYGHAAHEKQDDLH